MAGREIAWYSIYGSFKNDWVGQLLDGGRADTSAVV